MEHVPILMMLDFFEMEQLLYCIDQVLYNQNTGIAGVKQINTILFATTSHLL